MLNHDVVNEDEARGQHWVTFHCQMSGPMTCLAKCPMNRAFHTAQ